MNWIQELSISFIFLTLGLVWEKLQYYSKSPSWGCCSQQYMQNIAFMGLLFTVHSIQCAYLRPCSMSATQRFPNLSRKKYNFKWHFFCFENLKSNTSKIIFKNHTFHLIVKSQLFSSVYGSCREQCYPGQPSIKVIDENTKHLKIWVTLKKNNKIWSSKIARKVPALHEPYTSVNCPQDHFKYNFHV